MLQWLTLLLWGAATATPGPAPAEMVGAWETRDAQPSLSVQIDATGRFERVSTSVITSPNCDTRVIASAEGRLSVEGKLVHFQSETAKFRSVNTCRPRWDYEKPGEVGRNSYSWRVERQGAALVLVLKSRTGTEQRYYRR